MKQRAIRAQAQISSPPTLKKGDPDKPRRVLGRTGVNGRFRVVRVRGGPSCDEHRVGGDGDTWDRLITFL